MREGDAEMLEVARLPEGSRAKLEEKMSTVRLRRGETLVREGETETGLYLLAEGILRAFKQGEEESTIWFATEGEAVFSSQGYLCGRPSELGIVAECDSRLYRTDKEDVERLSAEDAEIANFFRRHMERLYMGVEEWMMNMTEISAEKRYLYLVRKKPQLLTTVKLKDIASYIYLRPQSLSRIRARIAKKRQ